jgi:hypothetical protein
VTSAPKEFEEAGLREFWCAADAAIVGVYESEKPGGCGIEERAVEGEGGSVGRPREAVAEELAVGLDLFGVFPK